LIEQVRGTNRRFSLDYPQEAPLAFTATLDARQLALPAGVEVSEINPTAITFELEQVVTRDLPVDLQKTGRLPDGYQLDGITLVPDSVVVTGPESEVSALDRVRTQRLSLDGLSDTKKFELPLEPPGTLSKLGVPIVSAEVRVNQIQAERTFEKVMIKVLVPYGYAGTVQPSRVKAIIGGSKELLDKLQSDEFSLRADAQNLTEGKQEIELTADLPKGLSIVSTDPQTVSINLVKQ
jgi:YbbR domain-containing protein